MKTVFCLTGLAGLLLNSANITCRSDMLDQWQWRNPLPVGTDLRQIVYGNGIFVIIGSYGEAIISTNGVDWKAVPSAASPRIDAVAFGNGTFAGVAGSQVFTSVDAMTWTRRDIGSNNSGGLIAYGNGYFLLMSARDKILTSPDGTAWTTHTATGISNYFFPLTYADGEFMGVIPPARVANSPDGITWSVSPPLTSLQLYTNAAYLYAVTRANGIYAAVGENDKEDEPGMTAQSVDLVNWFAVRHYAPRFNAVTFANGNFIAVGDRGGIVRGNADGSSMWIGESSPITEDLYAVAAGDGMRVATGVHGTIISSVDGQPWVQRSSGFSPVNLRTVVYAGSAFVAAGNNGLLKLSADGMRWTNVNSGLTKDLRSITYGRGRIVVVGQNGNIVTSSDQGMTWMNFPPDNTPGLYAVAFGNEMFVAVGDNNTNGVSLTSLDGTNWTAAVVAADATLQGITFAADTFVAVGKKGVISTSPDGTSWMPRASGVTVSLQGVTFGNGLFVAVGNSGKILTSPDAADWTARTNFLLSGDWQSVTFGNGVFVAVATSGVLASSEDGVYWVRHWTGNPGDLRGVAFGNGSFVVVGNNSSIMQSESMACLSGRKVTGADGFELHFSGERGRSYRIQASPDLSAWSDVFSFIASAAETNFMEVGSPTTRFYRTVSP